MCSCFHRPIARPCAKLRIMKRKNECVCVMKMHLFLMSSTLGRGSIPWLPVEMRELIYRHIVSSNSPNTCALTCRSCPRVLCVTTFRSASSYQSLLDLNHVCLECFSEGLI